MVKILLLFFIITLSLACAGTNNSEAAKHQKYIVNKWKELYLKCIADNPDNKQNCDKFKRSYKAESDKSQRLQYNSNSNSYY